MDVSTDELPIQRVCDIERRRGESWLIESLWLAAAAGIIGGQPKCGKSWLGLDMAVSVASGTACLGRFRVTTPGPALVFLAEDSVEQVRERVDGICKSRDLSLKALDLHVITAAVLRLDDEADRARLWRAVERLSPRLLLLDPLVRMHRLDENNARDIAGLLGFLREIQRKYDAAVVLTHHASKRSSVRPGQGLRGTSDLHAFGDSNLYLSRRDESIELAVEHRSALAIPPLSLQLVGAEGATHLATTSNNGNETLAAGPDLERRIVDHLTGAAGPIARKELRGVIKVNNQRFGQVLTSLVATGRVIATPTGLVTP